MTINQDNPVAIVIGGRPEFWESSQEFGRAVAKSMSRCGIRCETIPMGEDLIRWIKSNKDGSLFDATYGLYGHLDLLADAAGISLMNHQGRKAQVYDKLRFKQFLRGIGASTPHAVVLEETAMSRAIANLEFLGPDIVIKPTSIDALSRGVSFVPEWRLRRNQVTDRLRSVLRLDRLALVEEFAPGIEICVGWETQGDSLVRYPMMTIEKDHVLLDYELKVTGAYRFVAFNATNAVEQQLDEVANEFASEFEAKGFFYFNAIIGENGLPTLFDAGTSIGLGPHSYFTKAAEELGLTRLVIVDRLVDAALTANSRSSVRA